MAHYVIVRKSGKGVKRKVLIGDIALRKDADAIAREARATLRAKGLGGKVKIEVLKRGPGSRGGKTAKRKNENPKKRKTASSKRKRPTKRRNTPSKADLVKAVKRHARAHYNDGGWDYIVEAYGDEEILELIGNARTEAGAIRKVGRIIGIMDSHRRDIEGTAW